MPEHASSARAIYNLVHDELLLDGHSRRNPATFRTTWAEPEAHQLMNESLDKNMIDKDEYPRTAEIEKRCVHMIADLWHAPGAWKTVGCSTTGSSEARMLGGLALKWRWRKRRIAAGKSYAKPNFVRGPVQVCWEKFARYFDVEIRQVPLTGGALGLRPEDPRNYCDENTIGVIPTLGVRFTGIYEPVAALARALDELERDTGLNIPIHVDAASGGFIAPFIQQELEWNFRIERVKSISASGHKYGLAQLGVGWVVWRDKAELPEELIFNVDYLGGHMPTFALNFILLFTLGSFAVATVLPDKDINPREGLMKAFQQIFTRFAIDWATPLICVLLAFGGIGGVMSWISGPSRGLLWTAREGEIPPFLAKTNKNGVQISILIIQGVIVTVLAPAYFVMADVSVAFFLLSAVTITLYLIMYMMMYAAAIRLRYSQPDLKRSYRVPGGTIGMWCIAGVGFAGVAFAFSRRLLSANAAPGGEPRALCRAGGRRHRGVHRTAAADRDAEASILEGRQSAGSLRHECCLKCTVPPAARHGGNEPMTRRYRPDESHSSATEGVRRQGQPHASVQTGSRGIDPYQCAFGRFNRYRFGSDPCPFSAKHRS
jgi:hypothetical protein